MSEFIAIYCLICYIYMTVVEYTLGIYNFRIWILSPIVFPYLCMAAIYDRVKRENNTKQIHWFRTQLEFRSNVDEDGFVKCWVAGRPMPGEIVVQVPDGLKRLPIGSIVHAKTNSPDMTDFKDWELT